MKPNKRKKSFHVIICPLGIASLLKSVDYYLQHLLLMMSFMGLEVANAYVAVLPSLQEWLLLEEIML